MSARSTPRLLRAADFFAFVGPLEEVGVHAHRAPALIVGLDGPFGLAPANGPWAVCHGAWLPTGFAHRLDVRGRRFAVVYFDPVRHGALLGAPVMALHERVPWLLRARAALLRADASADIAALHAQLIGEVLPHGGVLGVQDPDPRLLGLCADFAADTDADWTLPAAARRVGLSASRLSHRFAQRTGVSWTAYRNWIRLADGCLQIAATPQALTRIAVDLGYSSAAHFAASFRGHLGISPSQLRDLRPQVVSSLRAADI